MLWSRSASSDLRGKKFQRRAEGETERHKENHSLHLSVPLSLDHYFLTLEVNPQTEFDLSWGICLSGDVAECLWRVNVQGRIAGLEVVQNVGELRQERHAHALGEFELLGHAQIEVPLRQAVDTAGAAATVVQSQNQPPELGVG